MNLIDGVINNNHISYGNIRNYIGRQIKIHGSVYKIRKMSDFAFVIIRTGREVIQCIYSNEFSEFNLDILKEESCIELTALVKADERSKTGWELQMIAIKLLSTAAFESPIVINNKRIDTSLDNLLNYRPITLRNEKERAVFKLQEGICNGFRKSLSDNSFTEIHTPKLVYAGAEGGANIFTVNYFGKEAYLAQSPQFYKQMMVGVFERVFEIGPVFRAEKHDTSRHLNEYTSVDFEMGYINSFEDIMQMEVNMLKYTLNHLQENYSYELELLKLELPVISGIPSIKFMEAKELIAKEYTRAIKDYDDFEPEEEKLLSEIIKNALIQTLFLSLTTRLKNGPFMLWRMLIIHLRH